LVHIGITQHILEDLPVAKYKGFLNLMDLDLQIPCYVLDNGQRVVGRTAATEMLTGIKGGGGLEKYLGVSPLKPFINLENVLERMVSFRLPEIDAVEAIDHSKRAGLQIADCIASAFRMAVDPDEFSNCECRYAYELKPICYKRVRNYLSYGVKPLPPLNATSNLSTQQRQFFTYFGLRSK